MTNEDLHRRLDHYLDRLDDAITFGVANPHDEVHLIGADHADTARTYALAAQAVAAALAVTPDETGGDLWPAPTSSAPPYWNMSAEDGEATP